MNAEAAKEMGGVNGLLADSDFICPECKGIIIKIPCVVHEEVYELGHKENCPFKQLFLASCKFE